MVCTCTCNATALHLDFFFFFLFLLLPYVAAEGNVINHVGKHYTNAQTIEIDHTVDTELLIDGCTFEDILTISSTGDLSGFKLVIKDTQVAAGTTLSLSFGNGSKSNSIVSIVGNRFDGGVKFSSSAWTKVAMVFERNKLLDTLLLSYQVHSDVNAHFKGNNIKAAATRAVNVVYSPLTANTVHFWEKNVLEGTTTGLSYGPNSLLNVTAELRLRGNTITSSGGNSFYLRHAGGKLIIDDSNIFTSSFLLYYVRGATPSSDKIHLKNSASLSSVAIRGPAVIRDGEITIENSTISRGVALSFDDGALLNTPVLLKSVNIGPRGTFSLTVANGAVSGANITFQDVHSQQLNHVFKYCLKNHAFMNVIDSHFESDFYINADFHNSGLRLYRSQFDEVVTLTGPSCLQPGSSVVLHANTFDNQVFFSQCVLNESTISLVKNTISTLKITTRSSKQYAVFWSDSLALRTRINLESNTILSSSSAVYCGAGFNEGTTLQIINNTLEAGSSHYDALYANVQHPGPILFDATNRFTGGFSLKVREGDMDNTNIYLNGSETGTSGVHIAVQGTVANSVFQFSDTIVARTFTLTAGNTTNSNFTFKNFRQEEGGVSMSFGSEMRCSKIHFINCSFWKVDSSSLAATLIDSSVWMEATTFDSEIIAFPLQMLRSDIQFNGNTFSELVDVSRPFVDSQLEIKNCTFLNAISFSNVPTNRSALRFFNNTISTTKHMNAVNYEKSPIHNGSTHVWENNTITSVESSFGSAFRWGVFSLLNSGGHVKLVGNTIIADRHGHVLYLYINGGILTVSETNTFAGGKLYLRYKATTSSNRIHIKNCSLLESILIGAVLSVDQSINITQSVIMIENARMTSVKVVFGSMIDSRITFRDLEVLRPSSLVFTISVAEGFVDHSAIIVENVTVTGSESAVLHLAGRKSSNEVIVKDSIFTHGLELALPEGGTKAITRNTVTGPLLFTTSSVKQAYFQMGELLVAENTVIGSIQFDCPIHNSNVHLLNNVITPKDSSSSSAPKTALRFVNSPLYNTNLLLRSNSFSTPRGSCFYMDTRSIIENKSVLRLINNTFTGSSTSFFSMYVTCNNSGQILFESSNKIDCRCRFSVQSFGDLTGSTLQINGSSLYAFSLKIGQDAVNSMIALTQNIVSTSISIAAVGNFTNSPIVFLQNEAYGLAFTATALESSPMSLIDNTIVDPSWYPSWKITFAFSMWGSELCFFNNTIEADLNLEVNSKGGSIVTIANCTFTNPLVISKGQSHSSLQLIENDIQDSITFITTWDAAFLLVRNNRIATTNSKNAHAFIVDGDGPLGNGTVHVLEGNTINTKSTAIYYAPSASVGPAGLLNVSGNVINAGYGSSRGGFQVYIDGGVLYFTGDI